MGAAPTVRGMPVRLTVVDSFTDRPFAGNPAAVAELDRPAPEAWMQAVAAEVHLSETAFVVPRADGDHDLRWFTPTVEVDLCGHATLAAAHVLGTACRFHTRSGVLTCAPGADGTVEMDFPAQAPDLASPGDGAAWAAALGLDVGDVAATARSASGWDLVEVPDPATVGRAVLDRERAMALGGHVIVAAAGGDGVDVTSRVFAPTAGIDEDPVTGSAHCVLAPWLAARTGGTSFTGRQASARGGIVGMRLEGERVVLIGSAVTVSTGVLHADPPPA